MLLPDGMKPIEEIHKGDWVWSTNPVSGETEPKQVEDVFVSETDEIVHVRCGDTEIDATPTHPFYTPDRGWVSAVNLRAGDRLQLVNGEYVTVEQVQHEILESPVKVYNFRVADNHTYYVGSGDGAVLVHNANCGGKKITDLGKAGEKAAGIKKNTTKVTIGKRVRIPDGLDPKLWVQEVKNVRYQGLSSQLLDEFQYAKSLGVKMELYVRRTTRISKPLQDAIKQYGVVMRYLNI